MGNCQVDVYTSGGLKEGFSNFTCFKRFFMAQADLNNFLFKTVCLTNDYFHSNACKKINLGK